MLLRFFRINDPYRLLAVLLAIIFLSLPIFINAPSLTLQELKLTVLGETLHQGKTMYVQVFDNTAPMAAWVSSWLNFLWGRSALAQHILAAILIFIQAAFFAIVLINTKAYNESTYLPAFLFAILSFFSFDLLSLSPELLASTFLLLALNNIFKEIEFRVEREEIVFNIGLYVGIASLFVFTYTVFLPGALLILIIFTRLSFRKAILLLFGFAFPHGLLLTFYFFWGNHHFLLQNFYVPNFAAATQSLVSFKSMLWLGAIPAVYFLFSLVMLNREAHFTKYQSQLLQVMLLWLVIAVFEIFLTHQRTPHSYFTFIPTLAYLISHYLLLIRRKRIADVMLWIFLIGIVLIASLARNGKIKSINYTSLFPKQSKHNITDKKVLMLSSEVEIYQHNRFASAFLNWELAKPILEEPDYYENVVLVDKAIREDMPDVIVDEKNYMQRYFDRIPLLKQQYRREGIYYYRISN